MNKYLFIIGFAGMALFSACSTSDELAADIPIPSPGLTEEEKALIVEAGKDSDVPITLGSVANSRATTRTPIDSDDGTDLFEITGSNDQYLGVFCLAQGKQAGAPSLVPDNANILWNSSEYAKWLDNVPAIVLKHNAGDASPITGGDAQNYSYVQFMKDDLSDTKVYYYPFGNWYYYDFFAYYPRKVGGDVWVGQGRVSVSYTINGTEDIMWARAEGGTSVTDPVTTNVVNSYSAKYLRIKKESEDEINIVPGLTFNHKLAQLVFSVKPHFEDSLQLKGKGYRVTKLKVIDVYNQLELWVADKTGGDHGALKIKPLSTIDDIQVRKTDGTDATPDPIDVVSDNLTGIPDAEHITPKEVGYALLPTSEMLTAAGYTNQYMVSIEMEQKDEAGKYPGEDGYSGNEVPNTVITLPLPTNGKFEAGKKYNITLEIYNPTNIQATATLAGWTDGYDDPDDGVVPVD